MISTDLFFFIFRLPHATLSKIREWYDEKKNYDTPEEYEKLFDEADLPDLLLWLKAETDEELYNAEKNYAKHFESLKRIRFFEDKYNNHDLRALAESERQKYENYNLDKMIEYFNNKYNRYLCDGNKDAKINV